MRSSGSGGLGGAQWTRLGGAGGGGVQPVVAVVAVVEVAAGAYQRRDGGGGFTTGAGGLAVLLLPGRFGGGFTSGAVFCVRTASVSPEGEGAPLFLQGGGGGGSRPRCAGHGSSGGGGGAPYLSVFFLPSSVGWLSMTIAGAAFVVFTGMPISGIAFFLSSVACLPAPPPHTWPR